MSNPGGLAQEPVLTTINTIMVNSPNTEYFVPCLVLSNEKTNKQWNYQIRCLKKLSIVKLLFKKTIMIYTHCIQYPSLPLSPRKMWNP